MHIEPGVVDGAKMLLSYGTAAAAGGMGLKLVAEDLKHGKPASFLMRAILATLCVFVFFEVLPHFPVGISEVHLILGTTLLLILGAGPAAVGLAGGLLIQSLFFAPTDLPMYSVNVTTLLVPLFAISLLAKRIIPAGRPYVDLGYGEVLRLSVLYQGGIVAWVAFWAFYGHGFSVETLSEVASFGGAYLLVIVVEPLADLAALALARAMARHRDSAFVTRRLHYGA
jgi:hypothetical protein